MLTPISKSMRASGNRFRHPGNAGLHHFNPVKHGYVGRVRDWPHSSFHRYVREGLLPADWAGDADEGGLGYGERKSSERQT